MFWETDAEAAQFVNNFQDVTLPKVILGVKFTDGMEVPLLVVTP